MRDAYFHEDEYCQIELLPLVNWDYCASQLQLIGKFSNAHKQGIGWNAIHIREQNPQRFLGLNISVASLATAIKPILAPYDKVFTGYSSYREEAKQTLAFGTEASCVLFAGYGDHDAIEDIWLDLRLTDQSGVTLALSGLAALAPLADLLLVDWGTGGLVELAKPDDVQAYFDHIVKGRANALQAMRNRIDQRDKEE
jgi:hypothetical protein